MNGAAYRIAGWATAAAVLAGVVAACGGQDEAPAEPWRPITIRAADGIRLDGRLYGGWGGLVVILSHMGRAGDKQTDWHRIATALADDGHSALTYNRRGVCPRMGAGCSAGIDDLANSWKDVLGAYRLAVAQGATRVVLVGASIGAMASLRVAARGDVDVAAIVEVAGINHASGYSFRRAGLDAIEGQKLFISTRGDFYGGARAAREWYAWAHEPKELVLLDGDAHGTDILRLPGTTADELSALILGTVEEAAR